jgi:hypothetical protein
MIMRTHVTLESTVGEFVVSLHLPVGLSFESAKAIVADMLKAIDQIEKQNAERASQQKDVPDVVKEENDTCEVACSD